MQRLWKMLFAKNSLRPDLYQRDDRRSLTRYAWTAEQDYSLQAIATGSNTLLLLYIGFFMGEQIFLRLLSVATIAVVFAGCSTVRVAANTQSGAGAEAARMMARWVDSNGDVAAAASWSRKVKVGVTVAEIEQAFASVAVEDNVRPVGELFVSNELAARSGKKEPFLKVYSYCDPATARLMVDFSPAMAAFLPCRVTVVEQSDGLWIYTMNMDMLIKMGREMPPTVSGAILRVRGTLLKMLDRGASGEF